MSLEQRLPGYRFGAVLVLLLVTFVFLAAGLTGDWVRPVTVLLEGATLLAALFASRVRRVFLYVAAVITVVGFVGSLLTMGTSFSRGGTIAILEVLLVGAAPIAIAWSIIKRRVIDIHTVLGAICIYVLLGMIWASMYTAISEMSSAPFFAEQAGESTADFLYFSYVTLTTVGYGDLTARGGFGRAVAVLEMLLGQIYLVTIVALLVSNLGRGRKAPSGGSGSEPAAGPDET